MILNVSPRSPNRQLNKFQEFSTTVVLLFVSERTETGTRAALFSTDSNKYAVLCCLRFSLSDLPENVQWVTQSSGLETSMTLFLKTQWLWTIYLHWFQSIPCSATVDPSLPSQRFQRWSPEFILKVFSFFFSSSFFFYHSRLQLNVRNIWWEARFHPLHALGPVSVFRKNPAPSCCFFGLENETWSVAVEVCWASCLSICRSSSSSRMIKFLKACKFCNAS